MKIFKLYSLLAATMLMVAACALMMTTWVAHRVVTTRRL